MGSARYGTWHGGSHTRRRYGRPDFPADEIGRPLSARAGAHMAGQLTQHWTPSVWGQVARIVANPPILDPEVRARSACSRKQRQVRLTDQQALQLVAASLTGASINGLATQFGVDHDTAKRRLVAAGVAIRTPSQLIPATELPTLKRLRAAGLTHEQLADRYGCCEGA